MENLLADVPMKLLVRRALAFLAWTPLLVATGCGNQLEGERCDPKNLSLDCESGLFCRPVANGTQTICCPISGVAAAAACYTSGTAIPDASPVDARSANR